MIVAMVLVLLFVVIVFLNVTYKLMKMVDKRTKIISELRIEIFSLTCDKIRLQNENEFLEKRLRLEKQSMR